MGCLGFVLATLGLLASCSGDEPGDERTGNPVGGNAGRSGSGANDPSNFGNAADGGPALPGARDSGTFDPGASECVSEMQTARPVPVDMYIMLDRSNSMRLATGTGASKWDAMRSALTAFIADPESEGLGVGLQYFPLGAPGIPESCNTVDECGPIAGPTGGTCNNHVCLPPSLATTFVPQACRIDSDCPLLSTCELMGLCELNEMVACFSLGPGGCNQIGGDQFGDCLPLVGECTNYASCEVSDYSEPAVPIASLPDNAAALSVSLTSEEPIGLTPTPVALAGAIDRAAAHAVDNPDHRVIAVLATDGLPTDCVPPDVQNLDGAVAAVATIAATGFASTPSIETYVIGVFAPDEPDDPLTKLDRLAAAGGTERAFIVDATQDVSQQLIDALAEIRAGTLDCEFQLPTAPEGEALDYLLVNVEVTSDGERLDLRYVQRAEGCDRAELGWFYDVEPEAGGSPTQIRVCSQTCTAFRNLPAGASVNIGLGCATRGPD
jgi:hypothetical protein